MASEKIQKEIDNLNTQSWGLFRKDNVEGMNICIKAESMAKTFGYQKGLLISQINKGWFYTTIPDYVKALEIFTEAAKKLKKAGDNENLLKAYAGISGAQYYLGNYEAALQQHEDALKLAQSTYNIDRQITIYCGICQIHSALKNTDLAIEFGLTAMKLGEQLGYYEQKPNIMVAIGDAYLEKDEYLQAEIYLKAALNYSKADQNIHLFWNCLYSLGLISYKQGREYEAETYFLKSAEKAKDGPEEEAILYDIANFYLQEKKYTQASSYAQKCAHISRRLKVSIYREKAQEILWKIDELSK